MTRSAFEPLAHQLLDLVFPRLCPGCQDPLPGRAQPQLCPPCQRRLFPLAAPFCPVCGEKFHGIPDASRPCSNCAGRAVSFDFARSHFHAHGLLRDLIHRLKYQSALHLAPLLAHFLGANLQDPRIGDGAPWILVPVPLHPRRQRKRRFNQAAELAHLLSAQCGWPCLDALRRTRASSPQADLDRQERLENLRGAFALHPSPRMHEPLAGSRVLLIDDVFTTGSTAHECAKVLKEDANVTIVAVIAVARAGNPALG